MVEVSLASPLVGRHKNSAHFIDQNQTAETKKQQAASNWPSFIGTTTGTANATSTTNNKQIIL